MLSFYPHPQPLSQHQERGARVFIVWLEGFSFSCWRGSAQARQVLLQGQDRWQRS